MVVGGHLSLRTIILTESQGKVGKGHLSLGKTILNVEPGRGGEGSFISRKTVEPGRGGGGSSVSRNNDCNCRTTESG